MGGGGGGQSQTTSGGIDPAFRPYLEEVLSDVTGQYRQRRTEGPEATVAGHVAEKQEALRAAQQYGRDLSGGISPEMIERDLRNLQGQQLLVVREPLAQLVQTVLVSQHWQTDLSSFSKLVISVVVRDSKHSQVWQRSSRYSVSVCSMPHTLRPSVTSAI